MDANIEDEQFCIKDLDTGQVIDIRNESQLEESHQSSILLKANHSQWNQFWIELHKTHHQLCQAAQEDDVETIKKINSPENHLPVDVNMKLQDQWCPLHYASINANYDAAKTLLTICKANPNVTNIHLKTPLHISVQKGTPNSIPYFHLLLQNKADLNAQDIDGQTPLHYASQYGHALLIDILVQSGADVSIKNKQNKTPIQCAQNKAIKEIFHNLDVTITESIQMGSYGVTNIPITSASSITSNIGPSNFLVLSILGKGSFGQVYKVRDKSTNQILAMKVIQKQKIFAQGVQKYIQTERNVLTVMNSPFIVKLYYAFQTENKLYLLIDYCPGGDLEQLIFRQGTLNESLVKIYAAEIVMALDALHKASVIYRDLKPSNIVIAEDGHIKLTDFGLCKEKFQNKTKSFCGSIAYLAPEMIEKKGHGFALDWYLLGVLIYELLDGYPPYYDRDQRQLIQNIRKSEIKRFPNVSEECKQLLKQLLEKNPQKRLGSKLDAKDLKNHSFFSTIDWKKLETKKYELPKPHSEFENLYEDSDYSMKITYSTQPEVQKSKTHLNNWSFLKQ